MNKSQAIHKLVKNFRGIISCDLREGEQYAGQPFFDRNGFAGFRSFEISVHQAKKILQFMYGLNVQYAELPNTIIPGISSYIRSLVREKNRPRLLSHIRNRIDDVLSAINFRVDGINILTTVDPERIHAMGYNNLSDYLEILRQVVRKAQNNGLEVRVSVEHAWNGHFDDSLRVYSFADALGAERIGLADTVGIATRWDIETRIRAVKNKVRRSEIEVHFHNDGSCAVNNAVEAVIAGANWVDTTALGYGERTGITPMGNFLYALTLYYRRLTEQLNMRLLTPVEQAIAAMLRLPVPHTQISSYNAFCAKAGIHLKEAARHSKGISLYEPHIRPEYIGQTRRFITDSRVSGANKIEQLTKRYG